MKSPRYFRFAFGFFAALSGLGALASQDLVPGSRYTSGRGDGMGGAYLPLGEDGPSGLFYQPAAIGKIGKPHFEALNLQLKSNDGYVSTINRDFYKVFSLSSFEPRLKSREGIPMGAGATAVTSFSMKGFAIGVLAATDFVASHEPGALVRYRSKYQVIPSVGGSIPLSRGIVRIGYSLQWVNQANGDVTVSDTDPNLGYNEGIAEGSGFSHNFGFALSLPIRYEPQFDLVVRNVGGLSFNTTTSIIPFARNPTGRPDDEPMTVDASFAIKPKFGPKGKMALVLEWRDITNTSGTSLLGRAALGAEFSFRDKFFLRTGWGRGYPSFGFGLKREKGELALAWYSEEIGNSYLSERDVKFLVHYRINAF